jgi:hypothetical protein
MEETALKWISTLGFPIFAACALAWALLKIFAKYEVAAAESTQMALMLHEQSVKHVATMTDALAKTASALSENVKATESNTNYLKKFGSDPMGLCKIEELKKVIIANGKECPYDDRILRNTAVIKELWTGEDHQRWADELFRLNQDMKSPSAEFGPRKK